MHKGDSAPGIATAPAGDLAQLVATELSLEQRLAEARREAQTIVEEASLARDAALQQFESERVGIRENRARQLETELRDVERRLLEEGRRKAEGYENLPDATRDELAEFVIDRLLRGVGS